MNITVNINNAKETVQTVNLDTASAQAVVLQAQPKVNYQLVDQATGFGPENIATKRVGNDLHIAFEGSDISEPDLIIEGYYNNDNTELLVGMHENGQLYAYVPETGLQSDAVSLLAEEMTAGQALGGQALSNALWAFSPWWLLALLPLAALAAAGGGGGGGGGSDKDTTAPVAPDVKANDDGSVTVTPAGDATKTTVTYTDESGNTKTVEFTKGSDGKWVDNNPNDGITVDPNTGVVTIPENQVKDGTDVTASNTDAAGNESGTDTDTAKDVTPPSTPDVVAQPDGSVTVTPADDATETTVTYTDEDGKTHTETFTKEDTDGDGVPDTWVDNNPNDKVTVDPTTGVVTIPEDAVKDGTDVTASSKDEAGNESGKDTDTAKDVTPPSTKCP